MVSITYGPIIICDMWKGNIISITCIRSAMNINQPSRVVYYKTFTVRMKHVKNIYSADIYTKIFPRMWFLLQNFFFGSSSWKCFIYYGKMLCKYCVLYKTIGYHNQIWMWAYLCVNKLIYLRDGGTSKTYLVIIKSDGFY